LAVNSPFKKGVRGIWENVFRNPARFLKREIERFLHSPVAIGIAELRNDKNGEKTNKC
jgi:hypothetical protein